MRESLGRRGRWALILLGATLLGVFFATQDYIAMLSVTSEAALRRGVGLSHTRARLQQPGFPFHTLQTGRRAVPGGPERSQR